MRRIVAAVTLVPALAIGVGSQVAIAADGTGQAQVRALEAQIEQLVERVCTLEAVVARLKAEAAVRGVQPAAAPSPAAGVPAEPEPWCQHRVQPDAD